MAIKTIIIKNIDTSDHTYAGQLITASGQYTIQSETELENFKSDNLLNEHIWTLKVKISDGVTDYKYVTASNYLHGSNEVVVQEEEVKTGGHYQTKTIKLTDLTVGWDNDTDISFPFSISLLSAGWVNNSTNAGDEIEIQVAPDTIIGAITSDISSGDTVFDVEQSVIDNIAVGYYVKLDDGTDTDDCGRVTDVDYANNKITVETAATQTFSATTPPTYIKQTIKMVPFVELEGNYITMLGQSKIGGSYIPANTIIRIRYNRKGTALDFKMIVEYLY